MRPQRRNRVEHRFHRRVAGWQFNMYINSSKKNPRSKIEKVVCMNYFKSYTDQAVEKEFGLFLVAAQLIHRLMQADTSCTTTAHLFFFPLLGHKIQKQKVQLNISDVYLTVPECIKSHGQLLKRDLLVPIVVQTSNIGVYLPIDKSYTKNTH